MIEPLDIHAYIDEELSPEQAASTRAKVEASPEASREAEAIRSLKKMLAEKVQAPAYQDAWANCVKRLDELDKAKDGAKASRIEALVQRFAPGLCVLLLAAILIVPRLGHRTHENMLTRDYARVLEGLSKSPAPDRRYDDFERYQRQLLEDSYRSTPDRLTINGMNDGVLDGVPVKQYSARDQRGKLMIYRIEEPLILKGTREMDDHPDLMVGNLNGMNCVVRTGDSVTVLVVAQGSQRKFEDLANVIAEIKTE